jgi:nucleotide-binding universal stress UspA family protein
MYSSILVAVDLDEPSSWEKSVPTALALSRCFAAKVAFVYVVPASVLSVQTQWSELGVRQILDNARARLARRADEWAEGAKVESYVTSGSVYGGVLEAAERCGADLIVLASHRPEMKDYLIGANASRVVRHARCSVMVVRD